MIFRTTFKSVYDLTEYDGERFEIIGDRKPEMIERYLVRFDDGRETYVWPEEVVMEDDDTDESEKIACISCGEKMTEDEWEDEGNTVEIGPKIGEPICEGCYSADLSEPVATMIYCEDGDRSEVIYIGSFRLSDEEIPEFAREYVSGLSWKPTDPWRGYFEGKVPEGFVNVLDTWFGIDGYFHGDTVLDAFNKRWSVEKQTPDFQVLVAFPRTSNVCSSGIEVMIPKDKIEEFANWLGVERSVLEVAA